MHEVEAVRLVELLGWVKGVVTEMSHEPNKKLYSCTIKQYVSKKTRKQLGLFFEAIEWFILERDEHFTQHVSEEDKNLVYRGIVEKYGYKKKTGFTITDMFGDETDQTVPIPLSECNRLEQFEAVFNGLFVEAAGSTPAIDMSGFIKKWEEIRNARNQEASVDV